MSIVFFPYTIFHQMAPLMPHEKCSPFNCHILHARISILICLLCEFPFNIPSFRPANIYSGYLRPFISLSKHLLFFVFFECSRMAFDDPVVCAIFFLRNTEGTWPSLSLFVWF